MQEVCQVFSLCLCCQASCMAVGRQFNVQMRHACQHRTLHSMCFLAAVVAFMGSPAQSAPAPQVMNNKLCLLSCLACHAARSQYNLPDEEKYGVKNLFQVSTALGPRKDSCCCAHMQQLYPLPVRVASAVNPSQSFSLKPHGLEASVELRCVCVCLGGGALCPARHGVLLQPALT